MKARHLARLLRSLLLVGASGMLIAGCAPPPRQRAVVEVACDEVMGVPPPVRINRQVDLDAGAVLALRLCRTAGSGFVWEDPRVGDAAVVSSTGRAFETPSTVRPGAAGLEVLTFEARGSGATSIVLDYSQPWQGGQKGVWRVTVDVRVS